MLTKNTPIKYRLLIKSIFLLPDNKSVSQFKKKIIVYETSELQV
jgi:hypothetical protein